MLGEMNDVIQMEDSVIIGIFDLSHKIIYLLKYMLLRIYNITHSILMFTPISKVKFIHLTLISQNQKVDDTKASNTHN